MLSYSESQALAEKMISRAQKNYAKWGDEKRYVLLAVLMEEIGEVSRAIIDWDYAGGDGGAVESEIIDAGAVLFQLLSSCQIAIKANERKELRGCRDEEKTISTD
jgi:NTP pyrophosphatase (non-canonical NTP hydrolase)